MLGKKHSISAGKSTTANAQQIVQNLLWIYRKCAAVNFEAEHINV